MWWIFRRRLALGEETADERSKAQHRLIRVMHKRGGRGFRILRSAETSLRTHRRR